MSDLLLRLDPDYKILGEAAHPGFIAGYIDPETISVVEAFVTLLSQRGVLSLPDVDHHKFDPMQTNTVHCNSCGQSFDAPIHAFDEPPLAFFGHLTAGDVPTPEEIQRMAYALGSGDQKAVKVAVNAATWALMTRAQREVAAQNARSIADTYADGTATPHPEGERHG